MIELFSMKNLILHFTEVAHLAAISAHKFVGLGDEKSADQAAVEAMRTALNALPISGTIVIGEGERDEAPMLYIGEQVGSGGIKLDIAVDPLEGTTILAAGDAGALATIACAQAGSLLHAPDVYMEKIAIGFDFSERIIDLDSNIRSNLRNIALAKKCYIEDLCVTVLNRPRHEELIAKIGEIGVRVHLIPDGDIAAVIATSFDHKNVYMGTGGAPEGVLAASALKTTGGQICGRLLFRNEIEKARAHKIGITDLNKQYHLEDMVKSDAIFIATGVTTGPMLQGVNYQNGKVITETIVMFSGDKIKNKVRLERNA